MAVLPSEFRYHATTGSQTGSDLAGPQNDQEQWLGGWTATNEVAVALDNVFDRWTEAEKVSSTRYRCISWRHVNASDTAANIRFLADHFSSYPSGFGVKFGFFAADSSTVAPVCTDENTAPAGINFFTPPQKTGVPATDHAAGMLVGPLNSAADGATELATMDDDVRIFLFIEATCVGVTGSLDSQLIGHNAVAET